MSIGHASAETARQTRCPGYSGHDNTTISRVLLAGDDAATWKKPCPTEECRAARDIICAADAYDHWIHPNSLAYLTWRDARADHAHYGRNILALGREHPERIPLYCKLLTEVAPTVRGMDAHEEENGNRDWTAYTLIDMAIRLDRPGNRCLARVMAAMPDTAAVREDLGVSYGRDCVKHIRTCRRSDPP